MRYSPAGAEHDNRKFRKAFQYFTVHNIMWRELPKELGSGNIVWKRLSRLGKSGVFEALVQILVE